MRIEDALARLNALQEQVATTVDAIDESGDESALADLEQLNRDGERGRDWQVLQRRIDSGETTLEAILGGHDTSPEAARVAAHAQRNLSRVDTLLEENARDDSEALDPRASAHELHAELNRRIEQIRRSMGSGST